MMRPNGPSERTSGIRFSSSSAIITSGSEKTSVLPLPVKAMPIMSRPARIAGSPWIWIGVGLWIPFDASAASTAGGKRMSRNDLIGGGGSSPSTRMCHLSRIACRSASLVARMRAGGRHVAPIDSVYSTPFASSFTDISGFIWLSIDSRILPSSTTDSSSLDSSTIEPLASMSARSSSSERFFGLPASSVPSAGRARFSRASAAVWPAAASCCWRWRRRSRTGT